MKIKILVCFFLWRAFISTCIWAASTTKAGTFSNIQLFGMNVMKNWMNSSYLCTFHCTSTSCPTFISMHLLLWIWAPSLAYSDLRGNILYEVVSSFMPLGIYSIIMSHKLHGGNSHNIPACNHGWWQIWWLFWICNDDNNNAVGQSNEARRGFD